MEKENITDCEIFERIGRPSACKIHGVMCESLCKKLFNFCQVHGHLCGSVRVKAPSKKQKNVSEGHFPCPLCDSVFKFYKDRKNHIYQMHREKKFECKECKRLFRWPALLEKHMNGHKKNKVQFLCKTCDRPFTQKRDLMRHTMLLHFKMKQFNCEICLDSFDRKLELNSHISNEHESENIIQCRVCRKGFKSSDSFSAHMLLFHKRKKFLQCNFCPKTFPDRQILQVHVDAEHQIIKIKRKRGRPKKNLETVIVEKKKKKIKENINDQAPIQNSNDEKKKDGPKKTFACSECEKKFKRNFDLKMHVQRVHKNVRLFSCELCQMSFKNKYDYNRHQGLKHSMADFVCEICKITFNKEYDLLEHQILLHKIVRNYACISCKKTFDTIDRWNLHTSSGICS